MLPSRTCTDVADGIGRVGRATVRTVTRTSAEGPLFEVVEPSGDAALPVVAHMPHAGTRIPADVRRAMLLDDAALERQRLLLTDWHTDRLFDWLPAAGASALMNRLSRLVVDPERFADDAQEPMASRGQGVVYTRTTDLAPMRADDPAERARLVATFFDPYHAALTDLVERVLGRFGRCLIVDGHSFGTLPLPSEVDQALDRPDICLGTDPTHTPTPLAAAMEASFRDHGFRVKRDSPFAGALVPLRHHLTDLRVASVMIEVRRGLYCDESTGEPLPVFDELRERLRAATFAALPEWVVRPVHPGR